MDSHQRTHLPSSEQDQEFVPGLQYQKIAHVLRHVSACLSSVTQPLHASPFLQSQCSGLSALLERLAAAASSSPSAWHDPGHHQYNNRSPSYGLGRRLSPASDSCLCSSSSKSPINALVELDILRALVDIIGNVRSLVASIAQQHSHHYLSSINGADGGFKSEGALILLKDTQHDLCKPHTKNSDGCLGLVRLVHSVAVLRRKHHGPMERECLEVDHAAQEFANSCATALIGLERIFQALHTVLEQSQARLAGTVHRLRGIFVSDRLLPSCISILRIKKTLQCFLQSTADPDESLSKNELDTITFSFEKSFQKKAEKLISKLTDPHGPPVIAIWGSNGLGKTCLASHVACDNRIMAEFPGGTYRLSFGYEPDLISLQESLWKQISGSRISFSSMEEGTTALMTRFSERLPSLVILDDIYDTAHTKPFMCFEGSDKGRLFVISHSKEVVAFMHGAYVDSMVPLDEQETFSLFNRSAICTTQPSTDLDTTVASVAKKCAGVPQLIQAAASIVYFAGESVLGLPSVVGLLQLDPPGYSDPQPTEEGRSDCKAFSKEESSDGGDAKDVVVKAPTLWSLLPYFHALGETHPCLQDCFLDLAAFPKGKWVCLSALEDMWGVGDGMDKERILLLLSLLVSRCLIEWRVETTSSDSVDGLNCLDQGNLSLQWRLPSGFYELAQALNEKRLEEAFINEDGEIATTCADAKGVSGPTHNHIINVLGTLQSATEAFNTCSQLWYAVNNDGLATHTTDPGEKKYRLFIPGSKSNHCPSQWIEGKLSNKATKLSLVCGSVIEVPSGVNFTSLKVALLSNNIQLTSISASALKCMEQLVVLDLKKCTLLALLPDSISTLQSLELLDLSSCTHLMSLPQSIGKLRSLKYLRLSGCLSLTHLPKTVKNLSSLIMLDLSMCVRLKTLPEPVGFLCSLQTLNLSGCYSIHCLPTSVVHLKNLTVLELSGCSNLSYSLPWSEQLKRLVGLQKCVPMAIPTNLWKLGQIEVLHLCSLKNLTCLPSSIGNLQHLRHLNLSSCRTLEHLPNNLASLFLLQKLDLSHTAIRKLPDALGQLTSLVVLYLRGCSRLLSIPPPISMLPKLQILDMAECWDFVMMPDMAGHANSFPSLLELDLTGCSIKQLPHISVGSLAKLQKLHLSGCQNLTSLPDTFGALNALRRVDLEGCKSISSLHGAGLGELENLSWLSLRNCCALKSLPVLDLMALLALKFLDVSGCSGLTPFPEPLLHRAREHHLTLVRWGTVWH